MDKNKGHSVSGSSISVEQFSKELERLIAQFVFTMADRPKLPSGGLSSLIFFNIHINMYGIITSFFLVLYYINISIKCYNLQFLYQLLAVFKMHFYIHQCLRI